jgi:hypothetical protein
MVDSRPMTAHSTLTIDGGSKPSGYFPLKAIEVVVFALILVLLLNRYPNGSEQVPILLCS